MATAPTVVQRQATARRPGVLIWDEEEGGAHNTWGFLHVTAGGEPDRAGVVAQQEEPPEPADGNSPALEERSESNASIPWPLVAVVGLSGLMPRVVASRFAARRWA